MRKRDGGCWARFASVLSVLTLLGAGLVLPTGSAGAAQPSGTPIKIGYLMTKTGPTDIDNAPSFAVAVKWINAHGGVAGHPVQLVTDLESGDVAVAVTDAKKLVGDGVDAIVDSDANDSAWASIPEKAGVPVFLSADTLAFAGSDDAFGSPQVVTVTTPLIMLAAKKFGGANKLAVLYCTEYSQCSQAVPYYSSIGKKYGVNVVYSTRQRLNRPRTTWRSASRPRRPGRTACSSPPAQTWPCGWSRTVPDRGTRRTSWRGRGRTRSPSLEVQERMG